MNRAWIALTIASGLAIALVFAGTIDPRKSDEDHVRYGSQFKCVAQIECREIKSGHRQSASCVIVSPRCVVTAAHVVRDADDWFVVRDDGSKHRIEGVSFPDDKSDIAACRIVPEDKFALDFYPPLYAGENEAGKVASIAGYGLTGTFATGATTSDGKRRAGSNVIDRVEKDLLICSIDGGRRTELEFLISFGDSGGGLFIGNELAGINSFIMRDKGSPKSRYGDESAHTRISAHRGWLESEMKRDD